MVKANFKNTLIVIPVYNSSSHLSELFDFFKIHNPELSLLCVNDGSTDDSLDIIQKYIVNGISFKENRGKGFVLKTGLKYAKDNGYQFVITIDSDLQHDPSYIKNFIKTQNIENSDLVIGFRKFSLDKMPVARIFSNKITSFIISYLTGNEIFDSQSGYRLYNLDLFVFDEIHTERYQMETEILLNYLKKRAMISHTEIPVIYKNEKSNISHLRDIKNFIKVILKEIVI